MAHQSQQAQDTASGTSTITTCVEDANQADVSVMRVKLKKPKPDRKVQWTTETVDNEEMNKKKSKCCCVYKKPTVFGESSSSESSDDECDHCQGHVEKKHEKRKQRSTAQEEARAAVECLVSCATHEDATT